MAAMLQPCAVRRNKMSRLVAANSIHLYVLQGSVLPIGFGENQGFSWLLLAGAILEN